MARIYNDITGTSVRSTSERYLSTWLFTDVKVDSDPIVKAPVAA